jgi:hypothetical protein
MRDRTSSLHDRAEKQYAILERIAPGEQDRSYKGAGAAIMVITQTHHHPMETSLATIANYENIRALTQSDGSLKLHRAP